MNFEKGDFIIVKPELSKPMLVRAVECNGKKSRGITEKSFVLGKPEYITFSAKKEVIANLGHDPKPGSAFGVKVQPLKETLQTNAFGDIQVFLDLSEDFKKLLLKRLFKMKKHLGNNGVHSLEFTLELRPKKGKWAGYYTSGKGIERMTLMPSDDWDTEMIDYVVAHEHGHAWWSQRMSDKRKLRWVKKYHDLVKVQEAFDKELNQMLDDIVTVGDIRSYSKDIDADTKEVLKSVFAYVKRVHKLTPKHLNALILNQDDVSAMWPSSTQIGKPEVYLTEYATTNPEELFAETFAYHMVGKKIPKDLAALMEKSLA